MVKIGEILAKMRYPGRGIIIGRSDDGKKAVFAYFIMGRSENSRNRIFKEEGDGLRTEAYDESKVTDPSLIIYSPVKVTGGRTIVTNGDQTDTIYDFLKRGESFEAALRTRTFEPDAPNFTPRISGLLEIENGKFGYRMSILKSDHGDPASALRFFYDYENPKEGEGRFLHTYKEDGDPLPSFSGEPVKVRIEGDLEEFTKELWENLDSENKISLYTRRIDIETGAYESKLINKYE